MRKSWSIALSVAGLVACAEGSSGQEVSAPGRDEVASLGLGLVERLERLDGAAFPGKSVRLSGRRRSEAAPTYPCRSRFEDACLDVRSLAEKSDSARRVSDLCPSVDFASSTNIAESVLWDFELAVFEGASCEGAQLTGTKDSTMVCYARDALGRTGLENKIVGERLEPGANVNDVVCIVKPKR